MQNTFSLISCSAAKICHMQITLYIRRGKSIKSTQNAVLKKERKFYLSLSTTKVLSILINYQSVMVKSCKEKTILPHPSISGIAEMYSISTAGNHFCHLLLPSPLTIYRIYTAFNKFLHTHTHIHITNFYCGI